MLLSHLFLRSTTSSLFSLALGLHGLLLSHLFLRSTTSSLFSLAPGLHGLLLSHLHLGLTFRFHGLLTCLFLRCETSGFLRLLLLGGHRLLTCLFLGSAAHCFLGLALRFHRLLPTRLFFSGETNGFLGLTSSIHRLLLGLRFCGHASRLCLGCPLCLHRLLLGQCFRLHALGLFGPPLQRHRFLLLCLIFGNDSSRFLLGCLRFRHGLLLPGFLLLGGLLKVSLLPLQVRFRPFDGRVLRTARTPCSRWTPSGSRRCVHWARSCLFRNRGINRHNLGHFWLNVTFGAGSRRLHSGIRISPKPATLSTRQQLFPSWQGSPAGHQRWVDDLRRSRGIADSIRRLIWCNKTVDQWTVGPRSAIRTSAAPPIRALDRWARRRSDLSNVAHRAPLPRNRAITAKPTSLSILQIDADRLRRATCDGGQISRLRLDARSRDDLWRLPRPISTSPKIPSRTDH